MFRSCTRGTTFCALHVDGIIEASGSEILGAVRLTEFWAKMAGHFGSAYAESIARDQVLATLGGRTAAEALAAGEDAKAVWRAVCESFEVPARDR